MTTQTIDRIERNMRVEGGVNAEFGGESGTNIRTGRRGESVMSAQVEFPVQEAQMMLAASLEEENRRATKIARTYFGARPQSFFVDWKGAKGPVDYTPDKDFDSDYSRVSYPMPGTDVQNLTIGVGQMIATNLMSLQTGREKHPWIDDPNLEGDLVVSEALERALLESLQTNAASGALPPDDMARIIELVKGKDLDLVAAVRQAQKEAQERQAAMAPETGAPEAAQGVDPNSPEAQPGLAIPGAGAEAGVAIPEGPGALGNLDQVLMQLRGTSAGAA